MHKENRGLRQSQSVFRSWIVRSGCGLVVGSCRVPGDFDVLQPVSIVLNDDIGSDGVAGLELIERRSGSDDVGHDHRIHETWDEIVVDDRHSRLLVDRNDFSREQIMLGSGLSGGIPRLRCSAVAASENSEQGAQADQ